MRSTEESSRNLHITEVDDSLGRASAHSSELEKQAQQLQVHFHKAMSGMGDITRLCDEADASVSRNQLLLNRSAHRIYDLNERLQQLIQAGADDKDNSVGSGPGSRNAPPTKNSPEGRLKATSKSKPSAGVRRPSFSRIS
mmetsp:Transcript_26674/g.50121  ORF Transcript_26674/g.50121 Transcript_26674/m.50121 type:complete len:140 (+) Transcript_26674:73-492(+)